ncbi:MULTISPECIES: TRAP transporter large permease [Alphaproteobacteria]|uniref:TRAP transporter large permease protein n=2 Tax=Alphaproteobacteria TaxID=28211 RepID=A0A512HJN3_9HYPH|nr:MULTISPECIES: TRAP transporter large permease [Alphaproteobacteria]GEO85666.1 C4-dicarboxylate ABC transporter permease [Ciceribacter naphthalenivorans]GLR21979.1 C4-dicarboxylate ABC transporter permease [Ciceribacter naphthalenivorans]GLT04835.1 C4-dicarboxylate ABC transporter permease [Sphingomonas psychrolutea]
MEHSLYLGLIGLVALVVLIGIRVPIAYAMILVGAVGTVALNGPNVFLNQLKTIGFSQFSKYDLSVIPMFVLMGYIATRAGLSQDLFRAANAWFGRMRGGVAMSAIAACAGFGAVCGSSLATATTMGQVALPELKRYKYSGALATGSLAAGGLLGILIPPSVVLVIYAIIVEANIVSMFAAALIPGLIAVVLFIITIAIFVRIYPDAGPAAAKLAPGEWMAATLGVLPVLGIFVIVIGGIYAGFYNPTPAAAVGVALVAVYGSLRRGVRLADYRWAILETAKTSGMIYLILLGAELLKIFMSRGGVPQAAAEMMVNSGLPAMAILVILLLALIVLGCLMDSMSMILLVMPFFWPVVAELDFGMDPGDVKIWFGVLSLIVVELGLITPPVGMNVFVISALAKDVPMRETFKGVFPFFGVEIVRLALLIAFPALSLWLPHLVSG